MTFKHSLSLTLSIFLLFLVGCTASNTQTSTSKSKASTGSIQMPSGWDDTTIDRIKSGEPLKKVLAVLDFEGYKFLKGKADIKMSDMLTTALVKTSRYEIVERNKIDKIFAEQNLGMSGMVDESSAAEVGKLLGAEYVVFGSITYAEKTKEDKFAYDLWTTGVTIDVRAVNTTTGKILLSETSTGKVETPQITNADGLVVEGTTDWSATFSQAARIATDKVAIQISRLEPLVGFVLNVESNQVIIDIGEEQGVNIGDIFVAFNVGDEILHPATGKRIGWKKEILQELEIISTEKTMSTVKKIKTESMKQLNPGDFVISR